MKDLVQFIAESLVDEPSAVQVYQRGGEHSVVLELVVAPDDMGKVIGKQGKIAKAMRTLLSVAGTRQGKRVILEIG